MIRLNIMAMILVCAGPWTPLSASVIQFDPLQMISLELVNGTTLTGRIIDVQHDRLQLVRAGFNRMVAFQDLSPSARKSLGLPDLPATVQPTSTTTLTRSEATGLDATRDRLRESLARFESSRTSYPIIPEFSPFLPISTYPSSIYPWVPVCTRTGFKSGWNIQINF